MINCICHSLSRPLSAELMLQLLYCVHIKCTIFGAISPESSSASFNFLSHHSPPHPLMLERYNRLPGANLTRVLRIFFFLLYEDQLPTCQEFYFVHTNIRVSFAGQKKAFILCSMTIFLNSVQNED